MCINDVRQFQTSFYFLLEDWKDPVDMAHKFLSSASRGLCMVATYSSGCAGSMITASCVLVSETR